MAKVTMDVSTEDAVNIILGCSALINNMAASSGEHVCDGWAKRVVEDSLLMAAKAIDAEHFDGSLTRDITFIEGSAE